MSLPFASPPNVLENFQLMQDCAEKLAALKKCQESHAADSEVSVLEKEFAALQWQLYSALSPDAPKPEGHSLSFLDPYLPKCAGEATSIGSIPHACGQACVGPCRFHRKGKCFDGTLCRFCHFPDEHTGAVKKVVKKVKKAKQAQKVPEVQPQEYPQAYPQAYPQTYPQTYPQAYPQEHPHPQAHGARGPPGSHAGFMPRYLEYPRWKPAPCLDFHAPPLQWHAHHEIQGY
jgi:hypothetical protein